MKKLIGYVLPETKIDNSSSLDKAICFPWLDLQSLDSSLDCEDVLSHTEPYCSAVQVPNDGKLERILTAPFLTHNNNDKNSSNLAVSLLP